MTDMTGDVTLGASNRNSVTSGKNLKTESVFTLISSFPYFLPLADDYTNEGMQLHFRANDCIDCIYSTLPSVYTIRMYCT